jgi:Rrf2 family protein
MRISAKGRYALASVVELARLERSGVEESIPVINISDTLGISKIYLEQVFVLLKKGGVVVSLKGSKGGHHLARAPQLITAWDVLRTVESALFDELTSTAKIHDSAIESTLQSCVYAALDSVIESTLKKISVQDILDRCDQHIDTQSYMPNM